MTLILLQVEFSSLAQFMLFRCSYAFQSTAEIIVFAETDLDKHQRVFIEHDDIDFAKTAVKVFCNEF